jgi:hypothetical protein
VLDVEHRNEHFKDFVLELLRADSGDALSGGLEGEGESDRLGDCEGGEMIIVLHIVHDLAVASAEKLDVLLTQSKA